MNTWRLRCIVAASQYPSLKEAAHSLNISQPALSKCIAAASAEMGTPLFERGRHLRLTPAGEEYVAGAMKILEIQRSTYELMRGLEQTAVQRFTMALSPHIGVNIYSQAFPLFYERYPQVQLSIHEGYFKDNVARVFNGECDLAFGIKDNSFLARHPLEFWPLYRTEWLLAVAEDHPLAKGGADTAATEIPKIDLALFQNVPFIGMDPKTHGYDILKEITAKAGFTPLTIQSTSDIFLSMQLARNFSGYTFIVDSYCTPGRGLRYFSSNPPFESIPGFYFRPGLKKTPELEYWIYLYSLQLVCNAPQRIDAKCLPREIQDISRRIGGVLHV